MRAMSVRGDIFRPEPEYMTIKSEYRTIRPFVHIHTDVNRSSIYRN